MREINSVIAPAQTIVPAAHTATATGTAVDLAGYEAAAVVIDVGAASDPDFAVEVQESATTTGGDFTAVADADLDGTEPATLTANGIVVIGYNGNKRYLRAVATRSGTGAATFGVSVVRAAPRKTTGS